MSRFDSERALLLTHVQQPEEGTMNGPFDFYLQAYAVGLMSGRAFKVVRVAPTHKKCWAVEFDASLQGAPA
jgi:hypothetical protein